MPIKILHKINLINKMGGICCVGGDRYDYLPSEFFGLQIQTIDGAKYEFASLKIPENKGFIVMNVATN